MMRKITWRKIILIALIAALTSCTEEGIYMELSRTNSLPFDDTPVVTGFFADRELKISWQGDPGADEYILCRDGTINGAYNEVVYRSMENSFIDRRLIMNQWYYYMVKKRRGALSTYPKPSDSVKQPTLSAIGTKKTILRKTRLFFPTKHRARSGARSGITRTQTKT